MVIVYVICVVVGMVVGYIVGKHIVPAVEAEAEKQKAEEVEKAVSSFNSSK